PVANSLTPQAMIPSAAAMRPQPYQASSQYQAPVNHITVKPADVHISTDVGRLEGVFSVLADNKIASYNDRQINDLMTSYPAR
ncbi:hypothetical protein, partial [Yersinia mollaretii]